MFFNGPPRSGKDTAANALASTIPRSRVMKFAGVLKRSVHLDYGLPPELPDDAFESCKDTPHPAFFYKTPRQAYIQKSEERQKPFLGKDIYGKTLLRRMWRAYQQRVRTFLISDSGFADEAEPILDVVGRQNAMLIRIFAKERGCTFQNDSRSYIYIPTIAMFDIENNSTVSKFYDEVLCKVLNFLNSDVERYNH